MIESKAENGERVPSEERLNERAPGDEGAEPSGEFRLGDGGGAESAEGTSGLRVPRQGLFTSFPRQTLSSIGWITGFMALATLFLEVATGQTLSRALDISVPFMSAPLGAGSCFIGLLLSRWGLVYAAGPLGLGIAYWLAYVWLSGIWFE